MSIHEIAEPVPGPQASFVEDTAAVSICKTVRGGGSTWALAFMAVRDAVSTANWRGLLITDRSNRLRKPDGTGLADQAMDLARLLGAKLEQDSRRMLHWPNGARLWIDSVANIGPHDYPDRLHFLGVDDAERCSWDKLEALLSRARRTRIVFSQPQRSSMVPPPTPVQEYNYPALENLHDAASLKPLRVVISELRADNRFGVKCTAHSLSPMVNPHVSGPTSPHLDAVADGRPQLELELEKGGDPCP